MIYAATSRGEVCFCTAEQAKLRGSVMETIQPTVSDLDLEDMMVSTFDWDERGAQLFAECVLLLRGADADTEPDAMEEMLREAVTTTSSDTDITEELRRTVEETEQWISQLNAQTAAMENSAPQEGNELFSYSNPHDKEQDTDLLEIMAMIHKLEERDHRSAAPRKQVDSEGKSLFDRLSGADKHGKKMPSRYTVAGKKGKAKMVHATEIFEPDRKIIGA
jgi:hypothetical protein